MDRNYWAAHIARLDPDTEYEQMMPVMCLIPASLVPPADPTASMPL